jgi:hypothetical protein
MKEIKLLRKEVRLDKDVVGILEGAAKEDRRGLINYMEKILIDKSIQIKSRDQEKVGGKK